MRFAGIGLAVVSAASFGLAGALAGGLMNSGWSAGAVTIARVGVAAGALLPFALVVSRGRLATVRGNAPRIMAYGLTAVAAAQFCLVVAVSHMQVAIALLIQQTAPAAVVGWLWLRHGQRPGPLVLSGAVLAAVGLVLVVDPWPHAAVDGTGAACALASMVGAAAYFLTSADDSSGLPALALAAGGLVIGAVVLSLLGLVGLLPLAASGAAPAFDGHHVPLVVCLLLLGLVTAALAYATGIVASRRLGPRSAAFVALLEVPAGGVFAWLLLGEVLRPVQLVGGLMILGGIVAVRPGEATVRLVVTDPGSAGSVTPVPRVPR